MNARRTPEEIERAADVDVRRADATLAALEQRVLDDDPDVTPQEIETARSARHFAGLRQRAAQRKASAMRAEQEAAEREATLAAAREVLAAHSLDDVADAYVTARKAVEALVAACDARTDAVSRAATMLLTMDGVTARVDGVRGPFVELGGERHESVLPGSAVRRLVAQVAEARPDGMPLPYHKSLARLLSDPRDRTQLDAAVARAEG